LEDNRRRGKIFSKRVRFSERANKDIGLKGSMAIEGSMSRIPREVFEHTKERKE